MILKLSSCISYFIHSYCFLCPFSLCLCSSRAPSSFFSSSISPLSSLFFPSLPPPFSFPCAYFFSPSFHLHYYYYYSVYNCTVFFPTAFFPLPFSHTSSVAFSSSVALFLLKFVFDKFRFPYIFEFIIFHSEVPITQKRNEILMIENSISFKKYTNKRETKRGREPKQLHPIYSHTSSMIVRAYSHDIWPH